MQSLAPSLPFKNKHFAVAQENFKKFCEGLSEKKIFVSYLDLDLYGVDNFVNFNILKALDALIIDVQSKGDVTNGCISHFSKSTIS